MTSRVSWRAGAGFLRSRVCALYWHGFPTQIRRDAATPLRRLQVFVLEAAFSGLRLTGLNVRFPFVFNPLLDLALHTGTTLSYLARSSVHFAE